MFPEFLPQNDGVFAWLRLPNQAACEAFAATVNFIIEHSGDCDHFRQFFRADSSVKRLGSVFTEDGSTTIKSIESTEEPEWTSA